MCDCCIPIIRVVQSLQWSLNLLMTNTLMALNIASRVQDVPARAVEVIVRVRTNVCSPAQQRPLFEVDMSWRTFKFFESEDVKDPEDTNAFNSLLKRPVSSSSNPMIFLIEAHCRIVP